MLISKSGRTATPVHAIALPFIGIGLWDASLLYETGVSSKSVYQMKIARAQVEI